LDAALKCGDATAVQDAIFKLGRIRDAQGLIPDDTAFLVIDILRRSEMKTSPLAGHVLSFFEFESSRLSPRAKDRCAAFLREWGDHFTDVHAVQLVAELRNDDYLKA